MFIHDQLYVGSPLCVTENMTQLECPHESDTWMPHVT